jgi:hypothetical protein
MAKFRMGRASEAISSTGCVAGLGLRKRHSRENRKAAVSLLEDWKTAAFLACLTPEPYQARRVMDQGSPGEGSKLASDGRTRAPRCVSRISGDRQNEDRQAGLLGPE